MKSTNVKFEAEINIVIQEVDELKKIFSTPIEKSNRLEF